jgi:putative IMPACT (imprinted ancient) family translation regulator
MLAVLQDSGLCEVVVVGTRFFGGIKLGTGGLVRAYSSTAREALQKLPTQECVLHHLGRIVIDYGLYGALERLLPRYAVRVEEALFADKVSLLLAIPYESASEFAGLLAEMSKGQITMAGNWIEDRYLVDVARKTGGKGSEGYSPHGL